MNSYRFTRKYSKVYLIIGKYSIVNSYKDCYTQSLEVHQKAGQRKQPGLFCVCLTYSSF